MVRNRIRFKQTNPFRNFIPASQILAYDPERPETATPYAFLNAVLHAFLVKKMHTALHIGLYLNIKPTHVSITIETLTGMSFSNFRDMIIRHELERLKALHPDWTQDQLAQAMGYSDRTAIWGAQHRENLKKRYQRFRQVQKEFEERWEAKLRWEREVRFRKQQEELQNKS